MKEGDSTLCVLLQLVDTLSLDTALISYLLKGLAFKVGKKLHVFGLTSQGRDVPLPVAFATLAANRPCGLRSGTYGTGVLG